MVRINRVYTKTGDDGTTALVGGERVAKDSLRVEAYGCLDELMTEVGAAVTFLDQALRPSLHEKLTLIQNELFDIGSLLASQPGFTWEKMPVIGEQHITRLEQWIDELNENLPTLTSFVLPGGCAANVYLHKARVLCRRTERETLRLRRTEAVDQNILIYLNRLSDLLFVMARHACKVAGVPEQLWKPGATM